MSEESVLRQEVERISTERGGQIAIGDVWRIPTEAGGGYVVSLRVPAGMKTSDRRLIDLSEHLQRVQGVRRVVMDVTPAKAEEGDKRGPT